MVVEKNHDRIIAWIAIPRTGTNFLCSLLHHHPLITSYYEIFHPQKFYTGLHNNAEIIIRHINQKYSVNFSDNEDIELIEWIHNEASKLINVLGDINSEKYVSFKLFPNHLKHQTIESAIINNKNIKKILVKRNLLAAYTSHEIALKTNKWNNFNTSEIRIFLSVEKFAKWVNWAEEWYRLFENNYSLGNKECFVINYEDIHAQKTNTDKLIYIDSFLRGIELEPAIEYQLPNINHISMTQKQDTRKNLEDKIINYQEFIKKAKDQGLFKYL